MVVGKIGVFISFLSYSDDGFLLGDLTSYIFLTFPILVLAPWDLSVSHSFNLFQLIWLFPYLRLLRL